MHPLLYLLALAALLLAPPVSAQDSIRFRRHLIQADSEFSAATAFDVNGDGRIDIVCGAWWYEAPDWKRHRFREIEQIRGRFDDYSNLALDVNQDGYTDIVSVNYRSKSLYWSRNPADGGTADEVWKNIVIDRPGASETGRLVDIDNDGRLDVLPNGTDFAAWYEFRLDNEGNLQWEKHDLPEALVGHGIGAGDINGDGRVDVVGPKGWAEGPEDPRRDRWLWHADFELARDCGLPILCMDVDRDGDTDLIWGRGHNIGLYWTEQLSASEPPIRLPDEELPEDLETALGGSRWITHAIDTRFACLHTLMLADIDGDQVDDLVVGKRFMGHDGKDPGENDPLSFHWYRFEEATHTWSSHPITFGGNCGVDLDSICTDLDGDGDQDILAPARCGLHWIENLRISEDLENAEPERPNLPAYSEHFDLSYILAEDNQRQSLRTALDHGVRRQHILSQMQLAMGDLPNSSRRAALDMQVINTEDAGSYWRLQIRYTAEIGVDGAADRVPAYLLIPKSRRSKLAAMLCLHPTQFELGKAQICGLGGKPSRFYAHELAERGFVCLAPDYPGFAEYANYEFERDNYVSGSMKAIWNNIRAIDLLETLPCVDADRIGVIGHSLGGHNALFTAAFDQRLRCVISSCGFNAFEDYYGGDLSGWTSSRYMPRIATVYQSAVSKMPFDFPEVLAAIAPRPLFVNAPLRDANFAVTGVRKCQASVEPLYSLLNAEPNCTFVYPDAEHDFPSPVRGQAYAWLAEQLKQP